MMADVVLLVLIVMVLMVAFGLFSTASARQGHGVGGGGRVRSRAADRLTLAGRRAMHRAGYQGGNAYANVADIGLLAYRQSGEPKLVRYGAVATDTDYLRPFAELWVPRRARGPLRFEIWDADGRLRYADEARYDLQGGTNTLLPGTWLPLRGKTADEREWTLRVLASGTVMAVHSFGWQPVGGSELQPYVVNDGEISPELQQALNARPLESVSLSDLLAGQDEH